jgi:hypothetical protein
MEPSKGELLNFVQTKMGLPIRMIYDYEQLACLWFVAVPEDKGVLYDFFEKCKSFEREVSFELTAYCCLRTLTSDIESLLVINNSY